MGKWAKSCERILWTSPSLVNTSKKQTKLSMSVCKHYLSSVVTTRRDVSYITVPPLSWSNFTNFSMQVSLDFTSFSFPFHIENLCNCCRHKYAQSISRIFELYFCRIIEHECIVRTIYLPTWLHDATSLTLHDSPAFVLIERQPFRKRPALK